VTEPYVQTHVLRNGSSAITFIISTFSIATHEGEPLSKVTATATGVGGSPEPVEYESVEAARIHWEYLVDQGWVLEQPKPKRQ